MAKALHRLSRRAQAPLIAFNCAALPEHLAESELFGHERGSFSGAIAQHHGYFEQANKATLFLDEIGELNLSLQSKLLRVLEAAEIRRIGGRETIKVDVRIIAATNRDLAAAVKEKTFREDLYYRLKRLFIKMPALRERRGDIPLLARHFASKYAEENDLPLFAISANADSMLQQYDWPGNARQLQNAMGQAVEAASERGTGSIRAEDLPEELFAAGQIRSNAGILTMAQYLWQKKREYAEHIVVDVAERDLELAAALLDVHPAGIHAYLRRLELFHLLP